MTVAQNSLSRILAECNRIRDGWSDAERTRRRKLGETRRLKFVRLMASTIAKQHVA